MFKKKQAQKKDNKIVWQPQKKQSDFMSTPVFECLFGGSAGGGKTDALLIEGLRQIQFPEYRAIMFRRTTKQLRRLIDRSFEIFPKICKRAAEFKMSENTWIFSNGSKYILSHMEEEKNKFDHDGQEYQYIAFDELTSFTESQYLYLFSRCRSSNPKIRCYIRTSAMPIGVGVGWVKQRFIDNGEKIIIDNNTGLTRQYISATLDDNIYLKDNDPLYELRLKLMGDKLFKVLRHGDWTVIEGSVFDELDKDKHMIPTHNPPEGAIVFRALDWGYAKPFSVGWFYENYDKQIILFREWYGCSSPDVGIKMGAKEVAKEIKNFEKDLSVSYGVADPSIWSKDNNTSSIADIFTDEGVIWQPAINDRLQGKMEVHNRLRVDEGGHTYFKTTDNCKHFWRTIPALQINSKRPEDVDSQCEDHYYDMVRYALMSKPLRVGNFGKIITGDDTLTASMIW